MQNRQNYDAYDSIYNSSPAPCNIEREGQFGNAQSDPFWQDIDNVYQSPSKSNGSQNQIEFLGVQSYCTISRGSLDIFPEPYALEVNSETREDFVVGLKSSDKSLIFYEEENLEEEEKKLTFETKLLSLQQSQIQNKMKALNVHSPKKHRNLVKNQKNKAFLMKHTKKLIRQLKRQYKYSDTITADLFLKHGDKISKIKSGVIRPIVNEKGHLSGLAISSNQEQFKVKIVNLSVSGYDPQMQLWDEVLQAWVEFQFKILLLNN